jgi:hypothetical protein
MPYAIVRFGSRCLWIGGIVARKIGRIKPDRHIGFSGVMIEANQYKTEYPCHLATLNTYFGKQRICAARFMRLASLSGHGNIGDDRFCSG